MVLWRKVSKTRSVDWPLFPLRTLVHAQQQRIEETSAAMREGSRKGQELGEITKRLNKLHCSCMAPEHTPRCCCTLAQMDNLTLVFTSRWKGSRVKASMKAKRGLQLHASTPYKIREACKAVEKGGNPMTAPETI
eukprot:1099971-Pelagomonas_calceolata.AAC.1